MSSPNNNTENPFEVLTESSGSDDLFEVLEGGYVPKDNTHPITIRFKYYFKSGIIFPPMVQNGYDFISFFLEKSKRKENLELIKIKEESERISKQQKFLKEYSIVKNCPECNSVMRFPPLSNDEDYYQVFASGIYSCFWNDLNERQRFCKDCESLSQKQEGWKIQSLVNTLNPTLQKFKDNVKINKAPNQFQIRFNVEDICLKYRYRKNNLVSNYKVKKMLDNLFNNYLEDFFFEVKETDDFQRLIVNVSVKKKAL
jgi:hypothetical protein